MGDIGLGVGCVSVSHPAPPDTDLPSARGRRHTSHTSGEGFVKLSTPCPVPWECYCLPG